MKLSPQAGHIIAEQMLGFTSPGIDSLESEVRDTVRLWFKMKNSGSSALIQETAWWMTRLMDPHGRQSRVEANVQSDELSSFAIATMGVLMDLGIIKFVKEPEIPKFVTSDYDPGNEDVIRAMLERMEATFKPKKKDEEE